MNTTQNKQLFTIVIEKRDIPNCEYPIEINILFNIGEDAYCATKECFVSTIAHTLSDFFKQSAPKVIGEWYNKKL